MFRQSGVVWTRRNRRSFAPDITSSHDKLRGKKLFSSLCCGFLIAVLLCFGAAPASAASLEELREERKALEQEKAANDQKLSELQEDTLARRAERDLLYDQIDEVQARLDRLRRQIDTLDSRIAGLEDEIAEKQEGVDRTMGLLCQRIRALYVAGDASALALLLGSEDLMDLSQKTELLQAVTRHDQELIRALTDQLKSIEADRDRLQDSKSELNRQKKELDAAGAELAELYAEAQQLLDEAENKELTCQTGSQLLAYAMQENEAAIAELERRLYGGRASAAGGLVGSGSFLWPMPGYSYLTCYFGQDGHRGIDVAGGGIYGKPIVAADGGTVIYAGWNDSYGYCVFIDHGNGYETRYAHMSQLGISSGASVGQGQVIGYVGSTGNSTGPHLHFEVIRGGRLTDPLGYF